ncbi:hypothetical protein P3383_04805 [Vibrio parahaemolyticus]|nr:hypothetical protein [Vibrio parahaemolyticus]MDF4332499.1 hypothetical protein [Vibrio parahaemolyticus]
MKSKLIFLFSLTALYGCADPFYKEIENLGYTAFEPPRANAKVGSVFTFEKNSSGNLTVRELCHYLYDDLTVTNRDLTFPTRSMTDTIDAGIAASLVKDLVSTPPKLDAGFRNVRSVKVSFNGVKSSYVTDQDLVALDGKPLPITPSCYGVLKRYSDAGLLSRTFLVVDIINVDSMNYTVEKNLKTGADVEFDIKTVVELKPNISFESDNNYSMKINENRSIGYKAFSITSFKPNGLVGPAAATIRLEPLTRELQTSIKSNL